MVRRRTLLALGSVQSAPPPVHQAVLVQHREVQTDGENFRLRGLFPIPAPRYQDGKRRSIRHGGTVFQRVSRLPSSPENGSNKVDEVDSR